MNLTLSFRFFGKLISGNHRNKYNRASGRYFHDKKYDKFLADVEKQFRKLYGYKIKPTEWVIEVKVNIYRNQKRGDADGFLKTIFDSLNGLAWKDDSQIKKGSFEIFDGEKPGFFIEVNPITKNTPQSILSNKKP